MNRFEQNQQDQLEQIVRTVRPQFSQYCPHKPFAKQAAFMMIPHDEALYGGALGGGKSDALLMSALQWVHVPGYAALILRKTLTDLKQSGALLDRMMNWMMPFLANKQVRYEGATHKFRFPTFNSAGVPQVDAVIQFGYIGQSNAFTRYQGIELQFCGFDEVTQHSEGDYEYLFTRLRKCVCPTHGKDRNGDPIYVRDCELCSWARQVPVKMRATCNPDGIGFQWVKKRFQISPNMTEDQAEELSKETGEEVKVKWLGMDAERPFLPASYKDNPYLDHKAYEKRLKKQLSPDLYEALMNGSWGVLANARFKQRWQRFYSTTGKILFFGPNLNGRSINMETDIQEIFQTVDCAATSMEGPGDTDLFPTRAVNPSFTVISTWALTKCYNLLWLHCVRFRDEIPEVVKELQHQYEVWEPDVCIVEENGVGKGVAQWAERMGMNIQGLTKLNDKVENATTAIIQMQAGRIWFPWNQPVWLKEVEDELFTWQGHPDETDDVVDTLAHAANHVDWEKAGDPDDYFRMTVIESEADIPGTVWSAYRYDTVGHSDNWA